jgi:hypothetical protein
MNDVIDLSADEVAGHLRPACELAPIKTECCERCGCAIEDLEELIYLRAADLIAHLERADPRDAWRHTGEQPPRAIVEARSAPEPYRTPQSTIDAFWYVVRLADPQRLAAWLDDHPKDEFFLLNLLESK